MSDGRRPAVAARTVVLGLVALVAIVGIAIAAIRAVAPVGTDLRGHPALTHVLADRHAPRRSVAGADLTLVAFDDFLCPACRRGDAALHRAVAADGRVTVVYRPWPIFGPVAERAARVAIAAAPQGIYPALHHRLMAERRPLTDAVLRAAVEAAGGDWGQVKRRLTRDAAAIDAQLVANARDAARLGLSGTPAYLVGPVLIVGAEDERGFRSAFARARRLSPPATP